MLQIKDKDKKLTYEMLREMTYMDAIISGKGLWLLIFIGSVNLFVMHSISIDIYVMYSLSTFVFYDFNQRHFGSIRQLTF